MSRWIRFALFGCAALVLATAGGRAQEKQKALDITIRGQIVEADAKDTVRMMPCKVHVLKLEKGKSYLIDMVSTDLDSYLRVEDSTGLALAQDDDGGVGLNARIRFTPAKDDFYKIIATTFAGGEGAYTLTVKDTNAPIAPVNPPLKKAPADPKKEPAVKPAGDTIKLETPTEKKPIDIQGQIQDGDPVDPTQNQLAKNYSVELAEGVSYKIDLRSTDFDTYLRIVDAAGKELAHDDDSGGNLNSRLFFTPPAKGVYRIVATTFNGGTGNFQLAIRATAKAAVGDAAKLETPTDKKPTEVQGQLADGDPIDPVRKQLAKNYSVELAEGVAYKIDLTSNDFDTFLRVVDAAGKELAQDDDGGGNLNARILFVPPTKGIYRIVATSFGGGSGAFQLAIQPTAEYGKAFKYDPKKVLDAKEKFFISGTLTNQDPLDAVQQQSPCQVHQVKLEKGKTYVIDLISGQMDCYLRIEDAQKNGLAEDDDGGEGLNSRLEFTPDDTGTFRLIATNLGGGFGSYILAIREKK